MAKLNVNGKEIDVNAPDDSPLLWALRDDLGLTGTKFGCGIGQCGACTVHMGGDAVRSCITTIAEAVGQEIRTIEGLADAGTLHPCQSAWLDEAVSQCGYCQPGQIMSAAALLPKLKNMSEPAMDAAINTGMAGNLCRCGTYPRIRKAIKRAAQTSG